MSDGFVSISRRTKIKRKTMSQPEALVFTPLEQRQKKFRQNGTTPTEVETDDHTQTENETEMEEETVDPSSQAHNSQSNSPRIKYDFSKVDLKGPIDNETLRKLLENFIKEKNYSSHSYQSVLKKYNITHTEFRLMLTNLKQEVPPADFLFQKIGTMLKKWPSLAEINNFPPHSTQ
jgi:hypothetical protein